MKTELKNVTCAQTRNTVFAALWTVAALAAHADAKDFAVPVDNGFSKSSLMINGYGIGYEFVIDVRGVNGEVVVCGAGVFPDASSALGVRRMLRKAAITLNGRKIIHDLSFFATSKRGADLFKGQAICRSTGVPIPKAAAKFDIVWPSGPIRF
jgi:hypothetical protein